jgi:cytosine/adenosine deaminase-related metal-dependent hydrolase
MRTSRFLFVLLFTCALAGVARAQEVDSYALRGTLVTPSSVVPDGTLLVAEHRIAAVGAVVDLPPNTKTIETDSFVFPGLIDLHNHLTWNLFPRWPPSNWKPTDWDPAKKFGARYDWQQLQSYKDSWILLIVFCSTRDGVAK